MMCNSHLYETMSPHTSLGYREQLIQALRSGRHGRSLSRLKTARAALLDLKAELDHQQSPNLRAAIEQTMRQLEPIS